MLGKIDKDFYCSANCYADGDCETSLCGCQTCQNDCKNHHRKHPTPEQFKEEYGFDYPDDWAVYCRKSKNDEWEIGAFWGAKHYQCKEIVCACTPFGTPDKDWRPE